MDFWRFFRGSENPSVLMRTRIFRFSEKLKKARIVADFKSVFWYNQKIWISAVRSFSD